MLIGDKMKKIKFNVKGMHCKSCEMLISESVSEIKGVKSVKADHKKGNVEVDFDDKTAKVETIKSVIKKEGYDPEW
jgi:copper ion binding protein